MRLIFDQETGEFDLACTPTGGLDSGVGNGGILETAIWASLFSDGVAALEDLTPDLGEDRRGWWGDSGRPPDHRLARSLLWLFMRAKRNEKTRLAIVNTAQECVDWLAEDGIVSKIEVSAEWLPVPLEGIHLEVDSWEPSGAQRNWQADLVWAGIAG